jgi:hypothetical protein
VTDVEISRDRVSTRGMQAIPGSGVVVTVEYSPDSVSWARLYDNWVLGWLVDENMPVPMKPAPTVSPEPDPLIVGSFPAPAPDTAPIVSPQWGVLATPGVRWGGVLINP